MDIEMRVTTVLSQLYSHDLDRHINFLSCTIKVMVDNGK